MSFPRYERYKESGIDWLGEVPEHWEIDRLKATVERCKNGIWGEDEQGDSWDMPCVRVADFDRVHLKVKTRVPTIRNIGASERTGRVIVRGDLLLEKSGGGDLQPVGFVVLYDNDQEAVCSNFVARMQLAKEMSPSYGRYLHATLYDLRLNTRSINQTSGIQNLDQASYLNEVVTIPPPEEQFLAARFLDYETAKIDALIEEQRRLIELLKEKRQAVISHAVTKGLHPDAALQDSEVCWLGKVPAHWVISRLGNFASVENGTTPSKEVSEYWIDGEVPWLASGEVNQLRIAEVSDFITDKALRECSLRLLPVGTLVVGMVGQGKTRGMSAILCISATINQNLAAIIPGSRLDSDYLLYVFHSAYESLREDGRGGRQAALNCNILATMLIPLPPLNEQLRITTFINQAIVKVDNLILYAEDAIILLQERRSALISAAVTGKINVRGYARQTGEAA